MKRDVINFLKEKGKAELFTEERYHRVKQIMKFGMKKDAWLNNYLNLDPLNKAQWICDHIIKLVELGQI
jgi:aminopeptidase C